MSELQAESIEDTDMTIDGGTEENHPEDTVEAEQPETVSESAADTGEHQEEKITFSPEQQQHVDEIVGKKVFKLREAERQTEKLAKQLEELKAAAPTETRPAIPDLPDPYDEDYEVRIQARDEALRKAATFDAEQRLSQSQQEAKQRELQEAEQQRFQETAQRYATRAKTLGIAEAELQAAGQRVMQFGVSDEVAGFILEEEAGPLITQYLSNNPLELDKLARMSPMNAGVYIATTVKSNATALKKKVTSAPDPVEPIRGNGAAENLGPKGATYE
jgi:hypothetical protein